jgi:hypothetical protein
MDYRLKALRAADHGRDPRFPLYSPGRAAAKRGGSQIFVTEAANLLPGLMAVPVASHRRGVDWMPADVTSERPWRPNGVQIIIAQVLCFHRCW